MGHAPRSSGTSSVTCFCFRVEAGALRRYVSLGLSSPSGPAFTHQTPGRPGSYASGPPAKKGLRRQFCSGASRTRTDDLLGAIRECESCRGGVFGSGERNLARWVAYGEARLTGDLFDLGTGSGLMPIHLLSAGR